MTAPQRGNVRADAYCPREIYRAAPVERLALIRQGLPAGVLVRTAAGLGMTRSRLCAVLGIPPRASSRAAAQGARLSIAASDRVVGLLKLIGQVAAMVHECGDLAGFDAERWLGQWLARPCPALGGTEPAAWLDTFEGQALIARLLAQMRSGAYA